MEVNLLSEKFVTALPWFFHLAGLIIGLGAVTVIDCLGFLGQRSSYWTKTTIASHKVTKPLIWIGLVLFLIGGYFIYQPLWPQTMVVFRLTITIILILNGIFLTFYVSPRLLIHEASRSEKLLPVNLQSKIFISFVISFLGWWGLVLLTAVFISIERGVG